MSIKRSSGVVPGFRSDRASPSAVSTLGGVDQAATNASDVLAMVKSSYTQVTSPVPTMTAKETTSGAASNTIDDDTGTFWRSEFCSYSEQWIQADFGVPITLSRISMQMRNDATFTGGVKVAVSDDGTTFTDIKSYDVTPEFAGSRLDFGVITARYWRILDIADAALKWEIYELDFYSQAQTWTSTPPNPTPTPALLEAGTDGDVLALNTGSYSAVSSPTPNAEATYDEDGSPNIVDGSTSTLWQSQFMSYYTQWIRLDYGEPVTLSRFVLDQHTSGKTTPSVKVSASNDGQTWTTLASVSGLGVSTTEYIDFPTTTATYFRVEDTNEAVVQWYVYRLDGWVRTETYSPRDTWLDAVFRRPPDETVHADDDEFSALSIDSSWTSIPLTGTINWTQKRSRLSFFASGNPAGAPCHVKALGGATTHPITIETACTIFSQDASYSSLGLILADGNTSTDNCVVTFPFWSTSGTPTFSFRHGTIASFSTNFGDTAMNESGINGPFIYQRLIWTAANTFKAQWSGDGISWLDLNGAESKTFTPTYYGVWAGTYSGAFDFTGGFEYFRVTESDLSA